MENLKELTILKDLSAKFDKKQQHLFFDQIALFVKAFKGSLIKERKVKRRFFKFSLNEEDFAKLIKFFKANEIKFLYEEPSFSNRGDSAFSAMCYEAYQYCKLTNSEQVELLKRYRNGETHLKETLLNHNLRYPFFVLSEMGAYTNEKEDLIQEGYIGILYAIDNYVIGSPQLFTSYVHDCIVNHISSYIRQQIEPKLLLNNHIDLSKISFKELCKLYNHFENNKTLDFELRTRIDRNVSTYKKLILDQVVEIISLDEKYDELSGTCLDLANPNNTDDPKLMFAKDVLNEYLLKACSKFKNPIYKEIYYYSKGIFGYPKLSQEEICIKFNVKINKINSIGAKVNKALLDERYYKKYRELWYEYLSLKEDTYERL